MQFPHPGRARRQLATGARASTARVRQLAGRAGWRLSVRRVVSCAVRPVSTVRSENRVRWSARESGGVGTRAGRGGMVGPGSRSSGCGSAGRRSLWTHTAVTIIGGAYCNASGPLAVDLPRCHGPRETSPEEDGWGPKSRAPPRCLT